MGSWRDSKSGLAAEASGGSLADDANLAAGRVALEGKLRIIRYLLFVVNFFFSLFWKILRKYINLH
jgi:hypothetical protein